MWPFDALETAGDDELISLLWGKLDDGRLLHGNKRRNDGLTSG
jgi:hypothetical protein